MIEPERSPADGCLARGKTVVFKVVADRCTDITSALTAQPAPCEARSKRRRILADFRPRPPGNDVTIKANFNSDDPFPASTHIETLRTVVENLKNVGVNDIYLAERSGMGKTREVLEKRGVFELANMIRFNVVVLDELDKKGWIQIPPTGIHWLKGFPIAKVAAKLAIVHDKHLALIGLRI